MKTDTVQRYELNTLIDLNIKRIDDTIEYLKAIKCNMLNIKEMYHNMFLINIDD